MIQSFRLFLGIVSFLSYRLLFVSTREISIATVILILICSFSVSALFSGEDTIEFFQKNFRENIQTCSLYAKNMIKMWWPL